MPDFVVTAKLIKKHLGLWKEQFLFETEISAILVYCVGIFSATHPFLPNIPATRTSLSWMASWGAPSAKPSRVWGTPPLAWIRVDGSFTLYVCVHFFSQQGLYQNSWKMLEAKVLVAQIVCEA